MVTTSKNDSKHLSVFTVRKANDGRSIWVRIGAAFPNKDGKGFSVKLDALPLDGELVIREPLPSDDQA